MASRLSPEFETLFREKYSYFVVTRISVKQEEGEVEARKPLYVWKTNSISVIRAELRLVTDGRTDRQRAIG